MKHVSVLLNETIEYLNIKNDGIYVDATTGGAGHSKEILKKLKTGFLYCFEIDAYAITRIKENLKDFSNFEIIRSNFSNLKEELLKRGVDKIDGIIYDLGLSSFQIDDASRGFSYMNDSKLDMRMDDREEFNALDILNNYDYKQLTKIFYEYGEEKNASSITKRIIASRPIDSSSDLVKITDIVNKGVKGHSAKRVFQALRIETNDELNRLKSSLGQALEVLNKDGRICIITFHSLEDRIVKHFFMDNSKITLPFSVDIRGMVPDLTIITKHGITPSEEEKSTNSRSISARLRVASKN